MSVAKTIEISSESGTSFDDAIKQGVAQAGKTVKNIKNAWVKDQEVMISDNTIRGYRVHLKVTFLLD